MENYVIKSFDPLTQEGSYIKANFDADSIDDMIDNYFNNSFFGWDMKDQIDGLFLKKGMIIQKVSEKKENQRVRNIYDVVESAEENKSFFERKRRHELLLMTGKKFIEDSDNKYKYEVEWDEDAPYESMTAYIILNSLYAAADMCYKHSEDGRPSGVALYIDSFARAFGGDEWPDEVSFELLYGRVPYIVTASLKNDKGKIRRNKNYAPCDTYAYKFVSFLREIMTDIIVMGDNNGNIRDHFDVMDKYLAMIYDKIYYAFEK